MNDQDPFATLLERFRTSIADDTFVSATCSGARRHTSPTASRVVIRPVDLRVGRRLQVTAVGADGRTEVTNLDLDEVVEHLAGLVTDGIASVTLRTTDGDLQLLHSRKGVARLVRHRPSATEVDTSHDRAKHRLVPEDAPFLRAVGISDEHGRVKPTARAKYRQVERFVEILTHTLPADLDAGSPLVTVDLGCGAGVLTFATDHHLRHTRGLDVRTIGIDTKAELMDDRRRTVSALGGTGPEFVTGTIADTELPDQVDLVLALHACDTATDDALARAVRCGARWILAAPCCQHDLQTQLHRTTTPPGSSPLLRHGIVRERLGDLLTDTLRAEILLAHGYRTDVIEFVSTEHTGKNLMIRAVRTGRADAGAARSARELAASWGVTPALARRIGYGDGDGYGDGPLADAGNADGPLAEA